MTLSDREMQILSLYCDGKCSKEIADILQLSPKTIKNYRHYLGIKMQCHTTVQLVMQAVKRGLVKL